MLTCRHSLDNFDKIIIYHNINKGGYKSIFIANYFTIKKNAHLSDNSDYTYPYYHCLLMQHVACHISHYLEIKGSKSTHTYAIIEIKSNFLIRLSLSVLFIIIERNTFKNCIHTYLHNRR